MGTTTTTTVAELTDETVADVTAAEVLGLPPVAHEHDGCCRACADQLAELHAFVTGELRPLLEQFAGIGEMFANGGGLGLISSLFKR